MQLDVQERQIICAERCGNLPPIASRSAEFQNKTVNLRVPVGFEATREAKVDKNGD